MPRSDNRHHILIVDDDDAIRAVLRECLEMEGFVTVEASSGAEVKPLLESQAVDLITLDINLGGESGFDLAREIRALRNIPIVMITGRGDTIDRVVGLELGADDYIAKPFHLREVVARIRAVLRRYDSAESAVRATADQATEKQERYAFGDFVLDLPRRELRIVGGETIGLTTAEFDMLAMFARRPSRVLSRDNIMDLLKGHDWSPLDRSIDALVVRVRRKIEADTKSPLFIKTVRGVGYVFASDVRAC